MTEINYQFESLRKLQQLREINRLYTRKQAELIRSIEARGARALGIPEADIYFVEMCRAQEGREN